MQLYNRHSGDFTLFLMKLTHQYKTFEKQNIIIDLLIHKELTVIEVKSFCLYQSSIKWLKVFYCSTSNGF
jgi:hypothetical protein